MFIARREAKCSRPRRRRAGHEAFSQRHTTSSSGLTSVLPHDGHASGMRQGCRCAGRSARTGPITLGMMSPPFSTTTMSPGRMSRRAISCSLCSVAICTVVPPSLTGSSTANGVTAPVRPTFTSIRSESRRRLLGRELERGGPSRKLRGRARAVRAAPGRPVSRRRRRSRTAGRGARRATRGSTSRARRRPGSAPSGLRPDSPSRRAARAFRRGTRPPAAVRPARPPDR